MKSALEKIPEKIQELIGNHTKDLEEAWANCTESDIMSISFGVKIGFDKGKGVCEVSISFTKEKVKDEVKFYWDDKQLSLNVVASHPKP